ncbi:serine hydrolase domain-containing protein [Pseudoxanthomonas sp. PXM02]|uniref:serine hydrolase domain-containing protein n=1 Tax=Pseudoxanthomonas sp. PXM02 TaxID=2769294 RepID=UPI00177A942E|nr:serine hydrolase domain-containing protein [Pseudoxanthomonas sp. PXM02]MBD9479094.1 beta-lactamase family protein [Pseudoxanthomonas sp. PXM02]
MRAGSALRIGAIEPSRRLNPRASVRIRSPVRREPYLERDMRRGLMVAVLALAACATGDAREPREGRAGRVPVPDAAVAERLDALLREHRITTGGFGVIRNGELVWSHYSGEEAPGLPASAATRFNVASITKTVVAETVLRLADEGRLDLDESLARYWVDPDVAGDPRRDALTARQVLDHTTGFPNWRFFRPDRKLAFEHAPGSHYGYSGEGFEYLARALAIKLGEPFPDIVRRTVLEPVGMHDTAVAVDHHRLQHAVRPVDEAGALHGVYCRPGGWCRPEGSFSAADDLLTTVPDYARLLAAVHRGSGYRAAMARERDRVHTDRGDERMVDCAADTDPRVTCPRAQGYGLGFEVADFGAYRVRGHGGSDWSEQSVAYTYAPSGDGVIVFLNAPHARTRHAMPDVLAVIDASSPFLARYRAWRDTPAP